MVVRQVGRRINMTDGVPELKLLKNVFNIEKKRNILCFFQAINTNKNIMVSRKNISQNFVNLRCLYNMKYVPNSRCSFCQEEETINHILWQ